MRLPARMSRRDVGTVLLVLATVVLFVVFAFVAGLNF